MTSSATSANRLRDLAIPRDAFDQYHVKRTCAHRRRMMTTATHLQHVVAACYVEAVFEVADWNDHATIIARAEIAHRFAGRTREPLGLASLKSLISWWAVQGSNL